MRRLNMDFGSAEDVFYLAKGHAVLKAMKVGFRDLGPGPEQREG